MLRTIVQTGRIGTLLSICISIAYLGWLSFITIIKVATQRYQRP